jgi:hypothetical protein
MSGDELSKLTDTLRKRAAAGASFVELVDLVHDAEGLPHYNRGIILHWFSEAFGLSASDFANIVFACAIFGSGASVPVEETESLFRSRLAHLSPHVRHAKDPQQGRKEKDSHQG